MSEVKLLKHGKTDRFQSRKRPIFRKNSYNLRADAGFEKAQK